jgi:predicted O-methyltransferase YrrM
MPSLQPVYQYIRHRLYAANSKGHGVHSPFLFDFIQRVLNDTTDYAEYAYPEQYRAKLLSDKSEYTAVDFGASARTGQLLRVDRTARISLQPPHWAQLLFRMIRYYRPGPVLELGTSLGVTTHYLALADPDQPILTLEGDPFIADRARAHFQQLGLANVTVWTTAFDERMPDALDELGQVGFALVDGNHRKEPTLAYVERLIPFLGDHSILVLDDIHWSRPMQEAWEQVKCRPEVRCTIDLFRMGIVLFRNDFHEPVHIRLRY